jgi:hypothetical protein
MTCLFIAAIKVHMNRADSDAFIWYPDEEMLMTPETRHGTLSN